MVTNVGVASACRPQSSTEANAGAISTIGLVPVDVPAVGPAELRPNPTRWNLADLLNLFSNTLSLYEISLRRKVYRNCSKCGLEII